MNNSNPNGYDFSRCGFSSVKTTPDAHRVFSADVKCFRCGTEKTATGYTAAECNANARRMFADWASIKVGAMIPRAYCPACADRLLNEPDQPSPAAVAAGWVAENHGEHDANGTA